MGVPTWRLGKNWATVMPRKNRLKKALNWLYRNMGRKVSTLYFWLRTRFDM